MRGVSLKMAHLRNEFVLDAGFSGLDVLDKLGEALEQIGMIPNASGWYDSFTGNQGSLTRVVESEYGGGGAYNKVYHAFMVKAVYDGLWCTTYYQWDNVNHESSGQQNLDYVSSYEYPDNVNLENWGGFYVNMGLESTAAERKIITYTNGGDVPILRLAGPGESRLYYFVPTSATLQGGIDYGQYGPSGIGSVKLSNSNFYVGPLTFLDRSIHGRSTQGSSGNSWTLDEGYGSHLVGGGIQSEGLSDVLYVPRVTGSAGLFGTFDLRRSPFYKIARNLPCMPAIYDSVFGPNLCLVSGNNGSLFEPEIGDDLVVTAGVEEYEVLQVSTVVSSNYWTEFTAILSRKV